WFGSKPPNRTTEPNHGTEPPNRTTEPNHGTKPRSRTTEPNHGAGPPNRTAETEPTESDRVSCGAPGSAGRGGGGVAT
ncbi:MAG: hypothetical protein AAFU77_13655, partial [Myxococcota bacterium]